MIVILALIAGAALGIGGLFGCAALADWWRRRKYVSRMDADKAGRLLRGQAVSGLVDVYGEKYEYRRGYEWCLGALFGGSYAESVQAEAERTYLNKKYPVKEAQP